jgi:hypothetical protein
MSEETAVYMSVPDKNGKPALPKRSGPKGMLSSTWLGRSLKFEYTDAAGLAVEVSGILLDLYPAGPVLSLQGARTLICWDRLCLLELVEEG